MAKYGSSKSRFNELKMILLERRKTILREIQEHVNKVRSEGKKKSKDNSDPSELDIQEDIELALIQMKSATLGTIGTALDRLEEGRYGICTKCGNDIAEARLRALPFALRCKVCEEKHEYELIRGRATSRRSSPFFVGTQK